MHLVRVRVGSGLGLDSGLGLLRSRIRVRVRVRQLPLQALKRGVHRLGQKADDVGVLTLTPYNPDPNPHPNQVVI